MTKPLPPAPRGGLLANLPPLAQWGGLLAISLVLATLFSLAHLPAALMLGPMIAGILMAANGCHIRPHRGPVVAAQTIVGCLVARAINGDIFVTFAKDWPLFVFAVVGVVAASALLGWLLARWQVLPGTTAVWGTAPGGASAMMLLSEAFGADARLVAFMQYLRVVFVAALATIVARIWVGAPAQAVETIWFPAIDWPHFLGTILVAIAGGLIAVRFRIPAGAMMMPMLIGGALEIAGVVKIILPPWLLALTYAFLGWSVGLGFTREILRTVRRALPQMVASILAIIGIAAALAVTLVYAAGIDPLTAYLATSPGGMDTIAIIAASSNVDLSFVMALQTARMLVVLIMGPPLARLISQRMRS